MFGHGPRGRGVDCNTLCCACASGDVAAVGLMELWLLFSLLIFLVLLLLLHSCICSIIIWRVRNRCAGERSSENLISGYSGRKESGYLMSKYCSC